MNKITRSILLLAIVALVAVSLAAPRPAEAFIDEIIAALCNGGDEIIPPGQIREGRSNVRALWATGFIKSIEGMGTSVVTINFDPDVPNSKFRSIASGEDVLLEDFFGDDLDLILSPGIEPDPGFPAHANCNFLNP